MLPTIRKRFALPLAILLILALLSGCSSSSEQIGASSAASYAPAAAQFAVDGESYELRAEAEDVQYDAPMETGGSGGLAGGGVVVGNTGDSTRKIVITVDLGLQTMEFDNGVRDIATLTEEFDGYIQDSYVEGSNLNDRYYSRSASYTVRIPVERLGEFLDTLGGKFNVVHQRQSSNDISNNYYDNKARLESLRVQEERLMEMLKQSGDLEYLLQVEQELANVLYEIELMTSTLNRMDDSVSMSTVTMTLREVVQYEEIESQPVTFGERVGRTLRDSWESFLEFCEGLVLALIALIPFLPLIGIVVLIVVLSVRGSRKRRAARKQQPQQPYYTPVYPMPQQPAPPAQPSEPAPEKPEDDPTPKK